jgi:hypothetical protein
MGGVETGVQTLYYGLGIVFMLGGVVAAYVRKLQSRIGEQEKGLVEYMWPSVTHRRNFWPKPSRKFLTRFATLAVASISIRDGTDGATF